MPECGGQAVPLLEQALALEADYASAHGLLAWCNQFLFIRSRLQARPTASQPFATLVQQSPMVAMTQPHMALAHSSSGLWSMIALLPVKRSSGRLH